MTRASTEDPLKAFRYRIEIDGFTRAGFTEATGLERETDVVEYREGGENESPQKSAGLSKFPDITLKRGQIINSQRGGDDDVINWAIEVHNVAAGGNGINYRRDLAYVQYNSQNEEVARWNIINAWPHRVKFMTDLKGNASEDSIEELVLCHEGFEPVPV